MALPTVVNISRLADDTYAERFHIDADVTGATFALTVEGLGSAMDGTIVSASATLSVVDIAIDDASVYGGAAGSYDWDLVMTSGGTTRTLIQGTWTIVARSVA